MPSHAWPRAEQEGQGARQSSELPPLLGGRWDAAPLPLALLGDSPCAPRAPLASDPLLPTATSQTRAGAGWPWGLPSFRRRAAFECTHLCSPRLPLRPGLTISVPTAARARGAEKGNRGTAWSRCQRSPPPTLPAACPSSPCPSASPPRWAPSPRAALFPWEMSHTWSDGDSPGRERCHREGLLSRRKVSAVPPRRCATTALICWRCRDARSSSSAPRAPTPTPRGLRAAHTGQMNLGQALWALGLN